jgi:hypothetical protein
VMDRGIPTEEVLVTSGLPRQPRAADAKATTFMLHCAHVRIPY